MGAGLSMASVNKIKELANSREYSLVSGTSGFDKIPEPTVPETVWRDLHKK